MSPSPMPSSHLALAWFIRGTGAAIALPSAVMAVFAIFMVVIDLFRHGEPQHWLMLLFVLLPLLMFGGLFLVGYCMWRRIDSVTLANFSFIFSLLTARALYHLLPVPLPKILVAVVGTGFPFLQPGDLGLSYRATFSFVAFFIFYHVLKAYLKRAFEPRLANPPPPRRQTYFPPLNPRILSTRPHSPHS
jgi:hypothetical protein